MKIIRQSISRTTRAARISGLVLRAALGDNRGGALVELAVVAPVFILLLLGATEFGRMAFLSIEVSNAALAGVTYAAQSTAASINTSGIQTAARNDAPNVTGIATLTVTPTTVCQCDNAGTFTSMASCAAPCSSPSRIITYARVNTSAQVATTVTCPGLPTSYTLQGQAIMRIK